MEVREDEKQDKALRLSREASRHTSGCVVCGLWCAGGRRVWVEMGLLLGCWATGRYPRLDALTCICLCPSSQREPVLAAACLN